MGHPDAHRYPLAYMWNELRFASDHVHARIATEAVVTHAAIVQAIAGGTHLPDLLRSLTDGD